MPSNPINRSIHTKATAISYGLQPKINFFIFSKFNSRLLVNKMNSVIPMRTRRKRILKICFLALLDIPFPIISFLFPNFIKVLFVAAA